MIPKTVKILGHVYDVVIQDEDETGNANLGTHWGNCGKIWLNKKMSRSQSESTLLHEILEGVNFILGLELKHEQIQGLEASLYQVLKDNKLW